MTEEARLTPQKSSEITALIIVRDPKITAIDIVIKRHLNKKHRFDRVPGYKKIESELEHIDAIVTGRRNLGELA